MPTEKDLKDSLNAAQSAKKITPPRPEAPRPPARPPAPPAETTVTDTFGHDTAMHLAFLGAGQGGGRMAQAFWKLGYRRVGVFNTTDSDFEGLDPEIAKLTLDIGGAAKDMQFARQNLRGREEEVRELLAKAWGTAPDCALICVGLGGGTGSGAALPLVQLARKYMADKNRPARVGAIISLPSVSEGQQVCRNAVTAFRELLDAKVSPLVIIDNARVQELYRPVMSKLLPTSNEIVSQLVHLFNQLAAVRSPHITFDRSEFAQLLDGGIVVFSSVDIPVEGIKNPADISKAIREELANSVLAKVDLSRGRKAACLFVAGNEVLDSLGLDYFEAGYGQLDRIVGSAHNDPEQPTVIHRGLYPSNEPGLQCYTMVSELPPPEETLAAISRVGGIRLPAPALAQHLKVD